MDRNSNGAVLLALLSCFGCVSAKNDAGSAGSPSGGATSGGMGGVAGVFTGGSAGSGGTTSNAGAAGSAGSAGAQEACAAPHPPPVPDAAELYTNHEVQDCATVGNGSCFWTLRYSGSNCPSGQCDKLLIYFSGGQMTCPGENQANSYLNHYASKGYVAVCARLYDKPQGDAGVTFGDGAGRVNLLVQAIVRDGFVRSHWNGKDLLIGGVSHGATTPVVAMARTDDEQGACWRGSRKTAACFFDGIYNTQSELEFLYSHQCQSFVGYKPAYETYCPWNGATTIAQWPTPSSCSNAKTAYDSIDAVDPSLFGISTWRLVECGSGSPFPCVGDLVTAAPIQTLCQNIDASPQHECDFGSYPNVAHSACGISSDTIDDCRAWFDAL